MNRNGTLVIFLILVLSISVDSAKHVSSIQDSMSQVPTGYASKKMSRRSVDSDDAFENWLSRNYEQRMSMADKRAAMGVDLPDYILHYNGKGGPQVVGSYREKMMRNGRK